MKRTEFLVLSAFVLFAAWPTAAQKFQPKSIQFKGAPDYSSKELLATADLKPGQTLDNAEMNAHSQLLMDTGLFDNLTFKFDGQDLIFTLIPNKLLFPFRLENLPPLPGLDYDAALRQKFPLYHGKLPAEGGLVESIKTALDDLLAAQGIQAYVTANPFFDKDTHKQLAVSLAITSPEVHLGSIHVTSVVPAATVAPTTLGLVALPDPPSDPKVLDILSHIAGSSYNTTESPAQIENSLFVYYRDRGYLEAKIHAVADPKPINTPEAIQIPYQVTIEPGHPFKIAAVTLDPSLLVSQADFDKQSHIHPGDIADGTRVRENWLYISRQYHNKGYMKAAVHDTPSYDRAAGTVSFAVTVDPGPVYTMGKLAVDNVADDLRDAMIAAWKLPAGAPFDESAIVAYYAMRDANPALGRVFAAVNCKYLLTLNDQDHTVDLHLRLEQKR